MADQLHRDADTPTGHVVLTLAFRREGRRWLGECIELGTATYGSTLDRTHTELAELIELHLSTLEATGERERFFSTHGIALYTEELPAQAARAVPIGGESYIHAHPFPVPAQSAA